MADKVLVAGVYHAITALKLLRDGVWISAPLGFKVLGGGTSSNLPPVAAFTSVSTALLVDADGSGSSDPDGTVVDYDWNWGDGSAHSSGATPSHTYATDGSFNITLTVTDDGGATNAITQTVVVSAGNTPPVARFAKSINALVVQVNGSTSTDADGFITDWDWNWGDSTTHGTGVTSAHTYAAAGTYTITLTVTDDQGATDTVTDTVTVQAANQNPVARFTVSATGLTASVNGATSTDDGIISNYLWDWGDSTSPTSGTGSSVNHTYAVAGTYTIRLTVTDNRGATGTVTHPVTVTSAALTRDQRTALAISSFDPRGDVDETWTGLKDASILTPGPNPGGTWTISTPGTYSNLDLNCVVRVTTTGLVKLVNCRQNGYKGTFTSQSGWFRNTSGGDYNLVLEDCLIDPGQANATPWMNGVSGAGIELVRTIIRRCTDATGQFTSANNKFRAKACLFELMSYFTPDVANPSTTYPNGRPNTHNDGGQIFGGTGIEYLGCKILGTVSQTSGTMPYGTGTGSGRNTSFPYVNGNGILMQSTTTFNITGVRIEWCDFGGFEAGITIVHKAGTTGSTGHIIRNNRFDLPTIGKVAGRDVCIQISSDNQGMSVPGFDLSLADGYHATDPALNLIAKATGLPVDYRIRSDGAFGV